MYWFNRPRERKVRSMLRLENVHVTIGKGTPLERKLFQDFSLHIHPDEFVVIIGGNGAGKSTLMNVISGYQPIDAGKIFLHDVDITKRSHDRRALCISHVMQDPKVGTMPLMTIEENLSFAFMRGQKRRFALHNTAKRRALFKDALAALQMGLEDRLHDFVGSLSGGQRQGVALIMATLAPSKILLLDEITAALDPKAAESVMQLASHIVEYEQRTAIMITHNMAHALAFGGRVVVMKNGQIIKTLTTAEKRKLSVSDLLQVCGAF